VNPLWILALLAIGKKKKNTTNSNSGTDNPDNPGKNNPVIDDYLDRM